MGTVSLICSGCSKGFVKPKKEYTRRQRLGVGKFYCSLSCCNKHENPPDQIDEFSPFKRFYFRSLKVNKKRFSSSQSDLSLQILKDLWEKQKGICPITGWNMILPIDNWRWPDDASLMPESVSLDRIDNTKGYTEDNIRFISVMANYARNRFTDSQVLSFAKAVASHNK